MDLSIKGKSWVGNVFHQFETICQEVDGFMSKETVKYVENQVQSVGKSVKKFYSDVVQDIRPPLGDEVKLEEKTLMGKQVDTRDRMESVTGIIATTVFIIENQLSVEQGPNDTLRNSSTSLPSEVEHLMQYNGPTCVDPSEESINNLPLREDGAEILNNECNAFDENISEICDDNHKNSTLAMAASPGRSVHAAEILTISKSRFSWNEFLDDMDSDSNLSNDGWLFESELSMVNEPISNEIRNLSPPPVASANKAHEEYNIAIDSAFSSGCESGHSNGRTHCDLIENESFDVSSTIQSTESAFSYFSCNNEQAEMGAISSSCSTSPKSFTTFESASANLYQKAGNLCSSHVESSNLTPSSATTAYDIKAMDILPALLISESSDANASMTHGPVSIVGSSQSRNEHSVEDDQSKFALNSFETGNSLESDVGITDLDMETVDLTTTVKHDANNLVMNGNFTHPTFHGRRNFRYYKKLIKDAFASRKRLSKEYEHLAIWYGDIDAESRQFFEPGTLPSSPITSVHAARTCDSEWELL